MTLEDEIRETPEYFWFTGNIYFFRAYYNVRVPCSVKNIK